MFRSLRTGISIFILLPLCVLFAFRDKTPDPKLAKILHTMYDSIKHVKTVHLFVTSIERTENKFTSELAEIKVHANPRKVYFNNREKKVEVLFDAEVSKQHAFVKVHKFPFLALNLDPTGNIMRKNQHYTIHELGYEFIGKSIAITISKDKNGLDNFVYHGKRVKNGYTCYMLEYENNSYAFVNYTVLDRETASSLAAKLCVNDYLLRNKNDLLNDFGYLKKGTVLKVPTLYCKKAILFIDQHLMLPVAISLYDDQGLFESYEYAKVEINKTFQPDEFTKRFKDYGF